MNSLNFMWILEYSHKRIYAKIFEDWYYKMFVINLVIFQ